MAQFSPPPLREPIAYVQIGRERVPVMVDDRWWDYLCLYVFERIGGALGTGTGDLATALAALTQFAEAEVRRKPLPPRQEDPVFRNQLNTSRLEMQIEELRGQLSGVRSENQMLRRELDDLRALMPRTQNIAALLREIDDLRATTS